MSAGTSSWQYRVGCKLFGHGDDTTVSQFFIGRNEGIDGTTNGQLNRFTFKYASASPSSFTLETDDVLKLTWTIAVGPE